MADDDCSNCDKENCSVRDFGYSCYIQEAKDIQKEISTKDLEVIRDVYNILYNSDDCDAKTAVNSLQSVIEKLQFKGT